MGTVGHSTLPAKRGLLAAVRPRLLLLTPPPLGPAGLGAHKGVGRSVASAERISERAMCSLFPTGFEGPFGKNLSSFESDLKVLYQILQSRPFQKD